MKITVEETKQDANQKATLECDSDEVPVDEAMDMLVKVLLAFGYQREAIANYFVHVAKNFDGEPKEENEGQSDLPH